MNNKKGGLRPIDKPHFRYWQALYHAFFNPRLYVDVGKRWKGFSLGYFFLVIMIAAVPFVWHYVSVFQDYFENTIIKPLDNFPILYVQNGKVRMNEPSPYVIKNSLGQVVAIIDTSGKTQQFTKQYPYLIYLVTERALLFRPPHVIFGAEKLKLPKLSVTKTTFSKEGNEIFDAKTWINSSQIVRLKWFISFALYPTLVLVIYSFFLVFLFALALMAQLVAKILMKMDLSYLQSFRLLMVAATPQMFLLLIMSSQNWIFKGFGIFIVAVLAVYFSFGVLALKRESHQMVRT